MISVRLADNNDGRDIFEWRNDADTRNMSHDSQIVTWQQHEDWFNSSLHNANRCLLICADSTKKIGMVRLDIKENEALISINLNPKMRGLGLAKPCLTNAMQFFKNAFPYIKTYTAEIKSVNIASSKAFENAGFVCNNELDGVKYYQMHDFDIVRNI
ncbi:MAG: GNAT family N-acetyltransferase [Alphaproteobacteria bacterium]|nr:GNAT family N-acetyltransferase [Alphaproteobacteria bacterium]